MNLLLDRPSADRPLHGALVTLLLAGGSLALVLILATRMQPWTAHDEPAPAAWQRTPLVGEPMLFDQVRLGVVNGA